MHSLAFLVKHSCFRLDSRLLSRCVNPQFRYYRTIVIFYDTVCNLQSKHRRLITLCSSSAEISLWKLNKLLHSKQDVSSSGQFVSADILAIVLDICKRHAKTCLINSDTTQWPSKMVSPARDGNSSRYYSQNSQIGRLLFRTVLNFFDLAIVPKAINFTYRKMNNPFTAVGLLNCCLKFSNGDKRLLSCSQRPVNYVRRLLNWRTFLSFFLLYSSLMKQQCTSPFTNQVAANRRTSFRGVDRRWKDLNSQHSDLKIMTLSMWSRPISV